MHAKKLYVGNIPFTATDDQLRDLFGSRRIRSVKIITDRETQRPRGFAFVELENSDDAASAVEELDGCDMGGRRITVNVAKERESSSRGGNNGHRNDRA